MLKITCSGEESVVYFTRDLSPEGLQKLYERVNGKMTGKIGIKLTQESSTVPTLFHVHG